MTREKTADGGKPRVLIVDDEPGICELLTEILHDEGYQTTTAHNGAQAHEERINKNPDVILLDIWMPDIDGISLIHKWKDEGLLGPAIIVMSGHATVDTAVEATKLGAVAFIEKPISDETLLSVVRKASSSVVKPLFNPIIQDANFGKSKAMRELKVALLRASAIPSHILMVGRPDCGASFFAGLLTPPGKQMETLLGGTELRDDPMQYLNKARGGVVFIPSIEKFEGAEMRCVFLLASKAVQMKTRVVAHSTHELKVLRHLAVVDEQLLAQFNETPVHIPSFSDFISDIPELSALISKQLVASKTVSPHRLSTGAINTLVNHKWEGNFSQLVKTVRDAMVYATAEEVDESVVRSVLSQSQGGAAGAGIGSEVFDLPLRLAREQFEREYFKRLMLYTRGNIVDAATRSGLERTYLYRKLKHLELEEGESE